MQFISPFLIPLAGIFVAIVAIISGAVQQIHASRLKADQRMALLARGMSPQDIESFLRSTSESEKAPKDPLRSLGNARRTAMVLMPLGIGLTLFFVIFGVIALGHINATAGWSLLACSASGLIPFAIGVGFLVDYNMQKRELSRFCMEIEADNERR